MDDERKIDPRFLAASLFAIAYGMDAFHDDLHTVLELHRFCVLALAECGIASDDSFAMFEDGAEGHGAAVSRTQFLMNAVERGAECLAESDRGEVGMLALQLSAVLKLQGLLTESDRRLVLEIIDSETSSSKATAIN